MLLKKNNFKKYLSCFVINYNNGRYLKECLESIISQDTTFSFDIVIIDDCSNDNSKEVFRDIKIKNDLNNIFFFSTNKNNGNGRKACDELYFKIKPFFNTKYIYRIDSDDLIIDKQKFQKQIFLLENNDYFIAVAHKYIVYDDNSKKQNIPEVKNGLLDTRFLISNLFRNQYSVYCHTSTYMFRNIFRSILPMQMRWLTFLKGDIVYTWSFVSYGSIFIAEDLMSLYRIHSKGIWSSLPEKKKKKANSNIKRNIFLVLSLKYKIYFLWCLLKSYKNNFNNKNT